MSIIINAINRQKPDKIALIDETGAMSYGALSVRINERAKKLIDEKVRALCILQDNGPEWIIWDLAALQTGTICLPLPLFFSEEQRGHALSAAGVTHIATENGLRKVTATRSAAIPDNTAKITFTSGTTGNPKGVCLSRTATEQVAQSLVEILDQKIAERHLCVLPLAILLENVAGVYATLLAGGTSYIYRLPHIGMANPFRPDFLNLLQVLRTDSITSIILVPELLRGLIEAVEQTDTVLPALEFAAIGGAKVSPALIERARQLGLPVYEGYGLSECASVATLNTPHHDSTGSIGKSLPHIAMAVEDGELVIKNPPFLGYLGEPESTRKTFYTGDLGHIDPERFFHINGRKKNILITSHGRNISPEWIEGILLGQPVILQTMVYGDACPHLSALVVSQHDKDTVQKAIDNANRSLPAYAQVRAFNIVAPFTMQDGTLTGTGRPRRPAIFKKYASLTGQEIEHELLQTAGQ